MALLQNLYAWTVIEADGTEGTIAADTGLGLGVHPLVARSRAIVEVMRPIAEAHGRAAGRPVCLVAFTSRSEIERIPPKDSR
jgi:hypothetical protein